MKIPYPTRTVVTTADLSTDVDVFPKLPGQGFLVKKSKAWSTGETKSTSGLSRRVGYWSSPTYTFQVKHNALRQYVNMLEAERLLAFFDSCNGKLGFFYYLDPDDYTVSGDQFGTGDGQTTAFQLGRILAKGTTQANLEPVRALWQTPTIDVAGAPTSAYALNTTGLVTFTTPPANGAALTWSGKFLYLCHFIDDTLDLQEIVKLLWSQAGLQFETLKG